ncbi:cbb3-type cytochrome c oxidase subunit 3 [Janthinobacterium sp.]|uniref:cbb3-type cytochrome oxidase subunit 3 n=1 Tax=Janthinobacterium sp. TaxID=1871054 RepID=UPI00293D75A6|nr:cbb3-type cytochrome c oxidase subunit 3 [Janthinobacterium sp.]
MAIENLFDSASSVMTVISFITFIGIMWWTFITHRRSDFDVAAQLPFADDDAAGNDGERDHV